MNKCENRKEMGWNERRNRERAERGEENRGYQDKIRRRMNTKRV